MSENESPFDCSGGEEQGGLYVLRVSSRSRINVSPTHGKQSKREVDGKHKQRQKYVPKASKDQVSSHSHRSRRQESYTKDLVDTERSGSRYDGHVQMSLCSDEESNESVREESSYKDNNRESDRSSERVVPKKRYEYSKREAQQYDNNSSSSSLADNADEMRHPQKVRPIHTGVTSTYEQDGDSDYEPPSYRRDPSKNQKPSNPRRYHRYDETKVGKSGSRKNHDHIAKSYEYRDVEPDTGRSKPYMISSSRSGFQSSRVHSASTSGPVQNSRAVISAMKALQDKIHRLEEDKERLQIELSEVKAESRQREAELTTSDKKWCAQLQRTQDSARSAYEALRDEREELKIELAKSDERRHSLRNELEHTNAMMKTYSTQLEDIKQQLQLSESKRDQESKETQDTIREQKIALETARYELGSIRVERDSYKDQLEDTDDKLQDKAEECENTQQKLHETERAVASITDANERLLERVKKLEEQLRVKKTKKELQEESIRALSRPTASSQAAVVPTRSATPCSTMKKKKLKKSKKGANSRKTRLSSSGNNMDMLRAANLGKDIPFYTGDANSSFSIIGNVQTALRKCDSMLVSPTSKTMTEVFPSTNEEAKVPRLNVEFKHEKQDDKSKRTLVSDRQSRKKEPKCKRASTSPLHVTIPTWSEPNSKSETQTQIMEDLEIAVQNTEAELEALRKRYDAMAKHQQNSASDMNQTNADNELYSLVDELEAKAKQVELLKNIYDRASHIKMHRTRSVVVSPEAIRRKTASLRLLSEYRELERQAQITSTSKRAMEG